MAAGAKGIKIRVAGRLQGAEMSRVGMFRKGRVPCSTLRAQLDYGFALAHTKSGVLGCKVWIFKGEVIGGRHEELKPQAPAPRKKAAK
jgi:small subunit ribosomal protein S3